MKRIGVLCSGGDSPGMNAALRALVLSAEKQGLEVFGIRDGYEGLVKNKMRRLPEKAVYQIAHYGGTILGSARSKSFMKKKGREKAYANLKKRNVEALVVIGGDGTFAGADVFTKEFKIPIVGLPGTIDNDLFGTDSTIGYDTALNTAVSAIDKIRDTASSHNRLFFVEVMGKDAGFIALRSGIASGAEAILVPETPTHLEDLFEQLKKGRARSHKGGIILVAEGDDAGGAFEIAEKVKQKFPKYDCRVTVLGHVQRGGSPSAYDRVLASRLGMSAVEYLMAGKHNVMLGIRHKAVIPTPFDQAIKHHKNLNQALVHLAELLN